MLGQRQEHRGQSVMMGVQGSLERRLQNGGPQLNLVLECNLLGPHYVKKTSTNILKLWDFA